EHDAARLHRRVGGYSGGDNLALRAQAFAFRIDQPGVILAQIEDATEQDGETDHVGENDAALQGPRAEGDQGPEGEQIVELQPVREGAQVTQRAGERRGKLLGPVAHGTTEVAERRYAAFQRLPRAGADARATRLDRHSFSRGLRLLEAIAH